MTLWHNIVDLKWFRLTASTVAYMKPEMKLIDVNGDPHRLTPDQVITMIIVGWAAFLLAGVMNIAYYKVHPSSVDFSLSRLYKKMFIYLLGMRSKKKLANLRTLSQLSLPSPPLSPIRTYLNWDIIEHCSPFPPIAIAIRTICLRNFFRTWALGEKIMDLCVFLHVSVCYFVDSCPLRALQKVLEGPKTLERPWKDVFQRLKLKKLRIALKLRIGNSSWTPPPLNFMS